MLTLHFGFSPRHFRELTGSAVTVRGRIGSSSELRFMHLIPTRGLFARVLNKDHQLLDFLRLCFFTFVRAIPSSHCKMQPIKTCNAEAKGKVEQY